MNLTKTFDPSSFTMSSAAIDHFKNSRPLKVGGDMGIRFSVEEASGCSGYSYTMVFVENHADEDFVFNCNDLKVYNINRNGAGLPTSVDLNQTFTTATYGHQDSIDITQDYLVLGMPRKTSGGLSNAGEVLIYKVQAGQYTLSDTINAPTPQADGFFGATNVHHPNPLGVATVF